MKTLLTTAAIAAVLSMPAHAQTDNDPNNFWVKYDKGWRFHMIDETKLVGKLKPPPKPSYAIDRHGIVKQDVASATPPFTTGAGGREPGGNVSIDIYPGHAVQYKAARAIQNVFIGNSEIVDAVPGSTDRDLVIQAKTGGETNVLLLDDQGMQIANLLVTATPATARVEDGKVRIYNKKDNVVGFANYQCGPAGCMRAEDKMEGTDRAKPPSTMISIGDWNSTVTTKNQP
jgi:hypothetical protein